MILSQDSTDAAAAFSDIPRATTWSNHVTDAVDWRTVAPNQLVVAVSPPPGLAFDAWQGRGFKLLLQPGGTVDMRDVTATLGGDDLHATVAVEAVTGAVELPVDVALEVTAGTDALVVWSFDGVTLPERAWVPGETFTISGPKVTLAVTTDAVPPSGLAGGVTATVTLAARMAYALAGRRL